MLVGRESLAWLIVAEIAAWMLHWRVVVAQRDRLFLPTLYVQVDSYHNADDLLDNGNNCEYFGNSCDPYFEICISPSNHINQCSIFRHKTKVFTNAKLLNNLLFEKTLSSNIKSLYWHIRVTIRESDSVAITDGELIAEFEGLHQVRTSGNRRRVVESLRSVDLARKGQRRSKLFFQMSVDVSCGFDWYGDKCDVACSSDSEQFSCDLNGRRICKGDWIGEDCQQYDYCKVVEPCIPSATCKNLQSTASCVCLPPTGGNQSNLGSFPSCYSGYDFCANHTPCLNTGVCRNDAGTFLCECPESHYGTLCEHLTNVCALKRPCGNNSECFLRANGGYACVCEPGYSGDPCKLVETVSPVVATGQSSQLIILGICATVLAVLLVLVVSIVVCQARRSMRNKLRILRSDSAYEQPTIRFFRNSQGEMLTELVRNEYTPDELPVRFSPNMFTFERDKLRPVSRSSLVDNSYAGIYDDYPMVYANEKQLIMERQRSSRVGSLRLSSIGSDSQPTSQSMLMSPASMVENTSPRVNGPLPNIPGSSSENAYT